MSFTLPNFNLPVNFWFLPNTPPAAPDVVVQGNLAWGRRVSTIGGPENPTNNLLMTLLLPPSTDVRAIPQSGQRTVAEVPAGSGRFYEVQDVDDIGKGFPNEHRAATLLATSSYGFWPLPYP